MQPAQRRAYGSGAAPVVAVLAVIAAAITGCTTKSATPAIHDGKPNSAGRASAEPGKYRNLPEACGTVSLGTLRTLLGGADTETEDSEEAEKVYQAQATVTYDTDRRVGCRWKLDTPEGSRHLTLDFERVVSYDSAVSDDDKALELYARKAVAAHVPDATDEPPSSASSSSSSSSATSSSGSASGSGSSTSGRRGGKDDPDTKGGKDGKQSPAGGSHDSAGSSGDADSGGTGPGDEAETDAPRTLDDLADNAFLDDRLVTADSGVHRDVRVVFRSSNVIVTIEYDEWSSDKTHIPSSEELQLNAEDLAQELTGRFDE